MLPMKYAINKPNVKPKRKVERYEKAPETMLIINYAACDSPILGQTNREYICS